MAKSTADSPVWFVTGCSTDFGREFVRAALAHGFRVVATARDPKKLDDLIAGHEDQAKAVALDVTNADQIKRAVSAAERAFGRMCSSIMPAMAIWLRWKKERRKMSAHIRHQLLRLGCDDPSGFAGHAGP